MKCIENIQVFISEPELIHRSRPPGEVALKAGSKLSVAERRAKGLDILDTCGPGRAPFHHLAEAVGKIQDSLIQPKTRGAEIASGERGERLIQRDPSHRQAISDGTAIDHVL